MNGTVPHFIGPEPFFLCRVNGPLFHKINPLLTKLVRSRWLDIGLVLFCVLNRQYKHAKNLDEGADKLGYGLFFKVVCFAIVIFLYRDYISSWWPTAEKILKDVRYAFIS